MNKLDTNRKTDTTVQRTTKQKHSKHRKEKQKPPDYEVREKIAQREYLLLRKSWDFAIKPLKQVPMNLFFSYITGNTYRIFPIMMAGTLFVRSFKILTVTNVAKDKTTALVGVKQRIVYLVGNLSNVAIALYKCHKVGILPMTIADWLAFLEPFTYLEKFGGSMFLV